MRAHTRRSLLVGGMLVLIAATGLSRIGVGSYLAYGDASTYATNRTCTDFNRRPLTGDADPALPYLFSGTWVQRDASGNPVNTPKERAKANYYWQDPNGTVHPEVLCTQNGYCQYGAAGYCTGWSGLKTIVQKEQRCYTGGPFLYWSWLGGPPDMPPDPGTTTIKLEPQMKCDAYGVGVGSFILLPTAAASASASQSSPSAVQQTASVSASVTNASVASPQGTALGASLLHPSAKASTTRARRATDAKKRVQSILSALHRKKQSHQ